MPRLKTKPPSSRWVKHARKLGFTRRTGDKTFQPLKEKLLAIGGWAVCARVLDLDVFKIIYRGRKFPGKSKTIRGEPSQCHSNVAHLYFELPNSSIVTGYALSRDGMWRQHSWLLHNNTVIETTLKRIQYYGFVLDIDEVEEFVNWNL